MMKLYGVRGWGSGIVEIMLSLSEIEYEFVDVTGFDKDGSPRTESAYDEIIATAIKRQHDPQRVVADLLTSEIAENVDCR